MFAIYFINFIQKKHYSNGKRLLTYKMLSYNSLMEFIILFVLGFLMD